MVYELALVEAAGQVYHIMKIALYSNSTSFYYDYRFFKRGVKKNHTRLHFHILHVRYENGDHHHWILLML